MSTTIDERVVEMRFDNRQFEAGVKTSLSTLDKLKEGLDLDGAAKGLKGLGDAAKKCDLSTFSNSVETVRMKFSALEVMAVTALSNITNSVINTGKRMIESFTLEPVKQGFDEYELKMGSIQTIMMSTGASLEEVNKYLQELNTYSDKTIYSFQDMTSNIGKFTNAGVGLEDAVMAIQGVSNVAAVSGANANEASRAMYNFAQALSAGYVKLIDWKSIENANMATVEFKTQLLESAVACGTLTKTADGMYKTVKGNVIDATHNFNDSLQDQWMTTEALVGTLRNYADETTDIGKKAFAAAQDVKTFSQLIDTLKEAAGSGWANTWEILFGDFEEAKELWTGLSQAIGGFIDTQSDARNSVLQGWKDLGGRTELIESLKNTLKGIGTVIKPITEAFRDIFPPTTAEQLHNLTEGLLKFTEKLTLSDTASENLKSTFKGLFAILDICKRAIGAILGPVGSLLGKVTGLGGGVLGVTGSIGEWLAKLDEAIKKNNAFGKGIEKISDFVSGAVTAIKNFAESVREYLGLPTLDEAKESMKELFGTAEEKIQVPGLELLHTILEKLKERAGQVKDAIVGLKDGISDAFSKIGGNTDVSKFAALIQALSIAAKKIGGGIFDALGNGINKIVTAVSNADFIEELQDMGPDAIAQIKALNNMSDSELEKYADLWKVKHAMAREQAVGELEGLREETQQNIAKLREEADQELTEYRALWQEKMNQVTEDANAQLEQLRRSFEEKVGLIKNNTEDELQEMADTAQKVLTEAGWDETGKQIVKGLTEGVQSEKSSFVDEITQLALAGVQAAKSTLDIHSPSRVFREIGNYTGLGFVKGLQDYVDRSYAAGSEMAESAEGGLSGVLQTIADIVSGGFDMEPVIRPVLDLSAVSAGADALNNLFYSQRAVGLVGQAAVAFEAQRGGSSQTTISIDNDDVVAELRTLRGEMASMLERMEKLRVVLNTGALVGELAEPMDVALGQRSTQRGRGI